MRRTCPGQGQGRRGKAKVKVAVVEVDDSSLRPNSGTKYERIARIGLADRTIDRYGTGQVFAAAF